MQWDYIELVVNFCEEEVCFDFLKSVRRMFKIFIIVGS